MLSRRTFLRSSALLALAPSIPAFVAQSARAVRPERDGRVLVVIQLDGGNDGINTVVPFADEGYAKYRKTLRLPKDRLVKIDDRIGLHPSLGDAGRLLETGRLAVIQGVGYPNPSRSHFESMAIWHSARRGRKERAGTGWLGTALDGDRRPADGAPASVLVGLDGPPLALRGRKSVSSALAHLDDLVLADRADPGRALAEVRPEGDLKAFVRRSLLDAYTTAGRLQEAARVEDSGASYPETGLASRLRLVSRLIKAGFGTRVFYTLQPGYDTHYSQLSAHATLLRELGGAVRAFLDDLAAARLAERVVVLCFSEFGRTVKENGSLGTDHGTAGPVFLAGPGVKAGVVGETPRLLEPAPGYGDLKVKLDFRRIYATILEDWLGLSARRALGGAFERLPLFQS